MRKNNGCFIFILIILAIAGVGWVRFYVMPVFVIFLIIAIINGKKKSSSEKGSGESKAETGQSQQGDTTGHKARKPQVSRKGHRNTENEKADDAGTKKNGTVITCEYCGSRVDTSIHNTCPHCGGPYYDNEQWKEIWKRTMG